MTEEIKKLKNIFKGDKTIWMIFFMLCIISVLEVYSSSASLGYKSGNYWKAAVAHTSTIIFGMVLMIFISHIPCRYFKALAPLALIVSTLMLAWVSLFGGSVNGASRWIDLGLFTIQPSEFAKCAMIMTTARILSMFQTPEGADTRAFKSIMWASCLLILPILPENFSTAFLLSCVVFMMMLIGRVPMKQIGKLISFIVVAAVLFITLALTFGHSKGQNTTRPDMQLTEEISNQDNKERQFPKFIAWIFKRFDTWNERITKFGDKENVSPYEYDLDKNSQVGYANIAIASSSLFGSGPGNSTVRDFLPLAFSDFIFAIILEELGWLGAAFVVLLYIMLVLRTGIIANRCANTFPALLAMGLALLVGIQALFNMMVAVGFVPVTGQPLPLISKGGTSTILNCIYIGMIISVSRTAQRRQKEINKAKLIP